MVTNGRKLSNYDFVQRIGDAGLTSLTVSIEGSSPEIHDSITKIPGSFYQTLDGIDNSIIYGFPTCTETTMCNENEKIDEGELLGDIGDSVNLSNTGVLVYIDNLDPSPLLYTVLDSNDNIVRVVDSPNGGLYIPKGSLSWGEYTIIVQKNNFSKSRSFNVRR